MFVCSFKINILKVQGGVFVFVCFYDSSLARDLVTNWNPGEMLDATSSVCVGALCSIVQYCYRDSKYAMQPLLQVSSTTVDAWKWHRASISPLDVVVLGDQNQPSPCRCGSTNFVQMRAKKTGTEKWQLPLFNSLSKLLVLPEIRRCQKSAATGGDSLRKEEDVAVEGSHAETDPAKRSRLSDETHAPRFPSPEPGRRRFTVSSWTERSDGWYQNVTDRERNSTSSPTLGA